MFPPHKWVYVTPVWCILMLWKEEQPPNGGSLRLYWISSPGHTRSGPPAGGSGKVVTTSCHKNIPHFEPLTKASGLDWTCGTYYCQGWLDQCGFWCNRSSLIIYSAFVKYLKKNGNSVKLCVSYLWILRKPMTQVGGRSW